MNAQTQVNAVSRQLAGIVASLGRSWSFKLTFGLERRLPYPTIRPRKKAAPRQPTNLDVANFYRGTDRDPFKLSSADLAAITRSALQRYGHRQGLNTGALTLAVAAVVKQLWVQRLTTGVGFPAPSAAWTNRKRRLGLSTLHMRASGQLLGAVSRAQVVVQRGGG